MYRRSWLVAGLLLASSCAIAQGGSLPRVVGPQDFPLESCSNAKDGTKPCVHLPHQSSAEAAYRLEAREPPWHEQDEVLGVALSGGGSKAAPFAMGLLAGLNDEGLLLPAQDGKGPRDVVIASVSGGGYAAYHLFSQLWWHSRSAPDRPWPDLLNAAYKDCVNGAPSHFDGKLLAAGLAALLCDSTFVLNDKGKLGNPEQYKLKCAQDILQPGECSPATQRGDAATTSANAVLMFAQTLPSLPFHHLANTLFDAGIPLSPSASIYRSGIGVTYGAVAQASGTVTTSDWWERALLDCPEDDGMRPGGKSLYRLSATSEHCRFVATWPDQPGGPTPHRMLYVSPVDLQFGELARLRSEARPKAPFWVIQATATKSRSLGGWSDADPPDIAEDTFEFTPQGFGSRRYGFVAGQLQGVSVLDATVSAAGFLDQNQQAMKDGPTKLVVGVGLHLLNLGWGLDIPNYNVSESRRAWHRMLPIPFYWADSLLARWAAPAQDADRLRSVYLRLNDGGNSEDLGLYALLRRGIRTAVIADASGDSKYIFDDLCRLHEQLPKRLNELPTGKKILYLHLPGLETFGKNCGQEQGYDLFGEWNHELPALLGCISTSPDDEMCDPAHVVMRLIVVKPRVEWNYAPAGPDTPPRVGRNVFERSVGWKPGDPGQVTQCIHEGTLYRAAPKQNLACYDKSADDAGAALECRRALPCDVVAMYANVDGVVQRTRGFPQTSTVVTTANSSGYYHAASRELARHYTRLAAGVIRDALAHEGKGQFRDMLEQQAKHKVPMRQPRCPAPGPDEDPYIAARACRSQEVPQGALTAAN